MTLFLHHHGAPYLQSVFLLRHSLHPRTQHRSYVPDDDEDARLQTSASAAMVTYLLTSLLPYLRPKGPKEIERVAGRASCVWSAGGSLGF